LRQPYRRNVPKAEHRAEPREHGAERQLSVRRSWRKSQCVFDDNSFSRTSWTN